MKIVTLKKLLGLLPRMKEKGKKIVFTNGCFDLLHPGHIRCLKKAREQGDILIVGLNSDNSVKKIKGPGRPFLPENERALMLAALEAVDYVVLFNESTPLKLIKLIQPDILVKGEEYRKRKVVGSSVVKKYGGKVVFIPMLPGYSTTRIAERLAQTYKTSGRQK